MVALILLLPHDNMSSAYYDKVWWPPALVLLSPVMLVLACISFLMGISVIVLTALYSKATSLDRQDKLQYISQIWVGTKSGFLHTLAFLWCPILLAFALYAPLRTLLPHVAEIQSLLSGAKSVGRTLSGSLRSPGRAAAALSPQRFIHDYSPLGNGLR